MNHLKIEDSCQVYAKQALPQALSQALDLVEGQPEGHGPRATKIALELADLVGLTDQANWFAYWGNELFRRFDHDGRNWLTQKWKEFVEYVEDKLDGAESTVSKLPPDDEINPEEGGWATKPTKVSKYFKDVSDISEPWNHGIDPKPIGEAASRLVLIPIQVMADLVKTTHTAPKEHPGKHVIVGAIPKGDPIESDLPGYAWGRSSRFVDITDKSYEGPFGSN